MKTYQKRTAEDKEKVSNTVVNIVMLTAFAVLEILGLILPSARVCLIFRVLSRGILGLTILFNGYLITFTNRWTFLVKNSSRSVRLAIGILLLFVGLYGFVTALLGYGTSGDPRLLWWK